MSIEFWAIVITMSIVAMAFVAGFPNNSEWRSRKALWATMAVVPVFAIALYVDVGSPDAIGAASVHQGSRNSPVMNQVRGDQKPVGSVDSMLDGLKHRLDENPEDAGSWLLLAKSYDHLNRREEAIAAYDRAKSLGKTDTSLAAAIGDVGAQPSNSLDPLPPGLRGRVELSDEARKLVGLDDTVFVFAKESADQRMPLVAMRRSVRDLPLQFNLTDADAMIVGTHLADYEELVVTAKISRSGMANDVLEGLEALSEAVSPLADHHISLTISSKLNPSHSSSTAND
ncbi:MAG: hypothetical protein HOM16_05560 [Woeseia sp.]|jgi:hypothetical protein|nr:hypothetical protein [Woeseia sp.]